MLLSRSDQFNSRFLMIFIFLHVALHSLYLPLLLIVPTRVDDSWLVLFVNKNLWFCNSIDGFNMAHTVASRHTKKQRPNPLAQLALSEQQQKHQQHRSAQCWDVSLAVRHVVLCMYLFDFNFHFCLFWIHHSIDFKIMMKKKCFNWVQKMKVIDFFFSYFCFYSVCWCWYWQQSRVEVKRNFCAPTRVS